MQQNFGYMDFMALRSGALRYRVRRLADPGKAPSPAADEIKPASKVSQQSKPAKPASKPDRITETGR